MASRTVTGNPGKSKKLKTVNTRISEELHAAVIAKSEATGVSYAHVIRKALEAWVDELAYVTHVREKWADEPDVLSLHKEGCERK
jgi:predicted DNA-binding protein